MSSNLRYPNITGGRDGDKIAQIQSYLYQLVDQLNYALQNIQPGGITVAASTKAAAASTGKAIDATEVFKSIKPLIIKSADIVNAYYEEISKQLSGSYVAESDFGTYEETTESLIEANAKAIETNYTDIQKIYGSIDGIENSQSKVNAHIKTGLLYYDENGHAVYGVEVGQKTAIDGVEVFRKYARFTSDRLSFYDQNDNEVAYISDQMLYITYIEVTFSYKIGGLVDTVQSDGSVVTRFVASGGDE